MSKSSDEIDSALLSAMRDNRERMNLLKLERTLIDFLQRDNTAAATYTTGIASNAYNVSSMEMNCQRFTSFHRLVLHRLADRFGILREVLPNQVIKLIRTELSSIPSKLLIDLDPSEYMDVSATPNSNTATTTSSHSHVNTGSCSHKGGVDNVSLSNVDENLVNSLGNLKIMSGNGATSGTKKMKIMKRGKGISDCSSNCHSQGNSGNSSDGKRSSQTKCKNLSDKEKAYEEARARIFGKEKDPSIREDGITVSEGGNRSVPVSNCSSALSSEAPSPKSSSPIPDQQQPAMQYTNDSPSSTSKNGIRTLVNTISNPSKVTWRNRKEEEADPDFRRRIAVPMYTTNNYVTGLNGEHYMYMHHTQSGQAYTYLQEKSQHHAQLNAYSRNNVPVTYPYSKNTLNQQSSHNPNEYPNSDLEQNGSNIVAVSTFPKPQDVHDDNSLNEKTKLADLHSHDEFPALTS